MKKYYHKFRQSPDDIKKRMTPYLRFLRTGSDVVDLGCGRGEFLGLLRDNGYNGIGVDNDKEMSDICRNNGFEIIISDIIDFLGSGKKYDAIFASHIIEHLNGETAEKMIELCYESLNPGGKIFLITPNSENLHVMTVSFWLDPTHVRFYPRMFLEELIRQYNFNLVESGDDRTTKIKLKGGAIREKISNTILKFSGLSQLSGYLYSGQDVYVVGEKL